MHESLVSLYHFFLTFVNDSHLDHVNPGVKWPAKIKKNAQTWHPAYVSDYLPTLLELLGLTHPNPDWFADGMSLMPLIEQLASGAANDTSKRPTGHPLVFKLGSQTALIDNEFKILENPVTGQCNQEKNSGYKGLRLFNLDIDPTESVDLSKDPAHAALFKNMSDRLAAFKTSVVYSATNESECGAGAYTPTPAAPTPPTPAPPTPPPTPSFALMADGQCLAAAQNKQHANLSMEACAPENKLQQWYTHGADGQIYLAGTDRCLKIYRTDCSNGGTVFLSESAKQCEDGFVFKSGEVLSKACTQQGMCLDHDKASLGKCAETACAGWSEKKSSV